MAEGAASEEPPQYPCPTDGSRDVEIGGDKSVCLNPTLAVETGFSPSSSSSSSLSRTATCSKTETKSTVGSVAAIDESRDVDKSKERGRKRAIELEPMDHSGNKMGYINLITVQGQEDILIIIESNIISIL